MIRPFGLMSSYERRNLNLYHRGGGGGAPLPSSYRNKALLIVAATAIYTAFLYNSGMSHAPTVAKSVFSQFYYHTILILLLLIIIGCIHLIRFFTSPSSK
jgi:hypothetical protein